MQHNEYEYSLHQEYLANLNIIVYQKKHCFQLATSELRTTAFNARILSSAVNRKEAVQMSKAT